MELYIVPSTLSSRATNIGTQWRSQDIVYVAIIGIVMLAALLEWFLWLAAFLYCLGQAFRKADDGAKLSIRALAVFNMIFFIAMRCVFLPVMLVTLPLPSQVVQSFPEKLVSVLQWFAFYTFAGLLIIPWLLCIYQLATHDIGRKRRIKAVLDEGTAPKVVVIMPCYNEQPEILLRTVDSIVDSQYPPSCIHTFLSFDGDKTSDLYLNTLDKLGVPLTLKTYPSSIDIVYRQSRITVSRFKHGGKRHCQKHTFRLVDKIYEDYLRRHDDLFVLFIDSDCILDKYCIQSFLYEMELKPGSKHTMLAQTGVITSTTNKNTLLTVLQDMEYIHGQLFERTVESACGAVTCLPGALTILRFSAFRQVARYYFADKAEHCRDLFDYGKMHLGEDRWLTHLFMISSSPYQIQMNTGAFCKTEAVQNFKALLQQRRRWFLGFITNEAVMLTDRRLWTRYPVLMLIRLAQNTIRTTALLFFIMVVSLLTTSQKVANLPVGFIGVSLGLNWVLMLYFGARLGRYKIMAFPLMFVINPFLNWTYMVYGIFTATQRTWGGPRADAGKADEEATAAEAIEIAVLQGDDLNVAPETFQQQIQKKKSRFSPSLLPSDRHKGRFAAAEQLAGGWFRQLNGSGVLARSPRRLQRRGQSRESWSSPDVSPIRPRRVESLVDVEASAIYRQQQLRQLPAGGAAYEATQPGLQRTTFGDENARLGSIRRQRSPSVSSMQSDSSVSLHFPIPRRRSSGYAIPTRHIPDVPTQQVPYVRRASLPNTPTPQRSLRMSERPASMPSASRSQLRALARMSSYGQRKGRSPLARKSFTRLASDQKTELSVAVNDQRLSQDERRGRMRLRPSVYQDANGRRRLSKQRSGQRSV